MARKWRDRERSRIVDYIDAAIKDGWTWQRIGEELGIGASTARDYHDRNKRKVRPGVPITRSPSALFVSTVNVKDEENDR
jgi:hypothetical protein